MQESVFKKDVLKGRVALITGGGTGIGFGITQQLGRHGCAVVIMGRRENFLKDAVAVLKSEGIRASYFAGDVRRYADLQGAAEKAVQEFGALDTLVNAAAGNFLVPIESLSPNGFKTVQEIDTLGVFQACRASFPHLKASKQGVIINISATLHYGATWWQCHVSAAKAAIDSLTRSMALEWGEYGIRVNGIAPGPISDTPGMTKLAPSSNKEAMEKMVVRAIPIGRMGTKWDIGQCAVYMASPAGSFVTGDVVVVDGANCLYKPAYIPRQYVSQMAKGIEKKSRSMGAKKSKL